MGRGTQISELLARNHKSLQHLLWTSKGFLYINFLPLGQIRAEEAWQFCPEMEWE